MVASMAGERQIATERVCSGGRWELNVLAAGELCGGFDGGEVKAGFWAAAVARTWDLLGCSEEMNGGNRKGALMLTKWSWVAI